MIFTNLLNVFRKFSLWDSKASNIGKKYENANELNKLKILFVGQISYLDPESSTRQVDSYFEKFPETSFVVVRNKNTTIKISC